MNVQYPGRVWPLVNRTPQLNICIKSISASKPQGLRLRYPFDDDPGGVVLKRLGGDYRGGGSFGNFYRNIRIFLCYVYIM